MCQAHIVDVCAGIRSGENEADLADDAMHDVLATLYELVSVDGQTYDIAMLDDFLGSLSLGGFVEAALTVDVAVTCREQRMTENLLDITMHMRPYERNGRAVAILESIWKDGPSISTRNVASSGVATEVILFLTHAFSFPLVPLLFSRRLRWRGNLPFR